MSVSASNTVFSASIREHDVQTTWQVLKQNAQAILIDVRTEGEWQQGVADVSATNNEFIQLSWRVQPGMVVNPEFTQQLATQIADRDTPLYFICKSGGRSAEAASNMALLGYTHCVNVLGGFDAWSAQNLPRSNS